MRDGSVAGLQVRWAGGDDGQGGGDGPLVILLHGYGAPGDDLVPLWRTIDGIPKTRFLFPEGPIAMMPELGGGRAWWDIDIVEYQLAMMAGKERELTFRLPEGLSEARQGVAALLAELGSASLPAPKDGQLFLGGFSQGAMLSLDVALHGDVPLSGLVLLSGSLIAREEWLPRMPSRRGVPVFQSHGSDDAILPFNIAEELREELGKAGLPVTWVPFRGGHGIAPAVLDALGVFFRRAGSGSAEG